MRDQFRETGGILLENAIAFWIERVYTQARVAMYRLFREQDVDMTPERWAVLVRLWEEDGLSQSELGARTFKDKPTISRIVDGMEAKGWVVRRDGADARTRLVHLTARGRKMEKELVPAAKKLVARLERGIPEEDLVVTRRTLQKMFANIDG